MQLIKLNKKVDSTTDLIKSALYIYCYMKDIKLSDSELNTLAYFIVYGLKEETIELVIKSKILKRGSLDNSLSRFRKYNFIKRVNKTDYLNDDFKFSIDGEIGILLRITNEKY